VLAELKHLDATRGTGKEATKVTSMCRGREEGHEKGKRGSRRAKGEAEGKADNGHRRVERIVKAAQQFNEARRRKSLLRGI